MSIKNIEDSLNIVYDISSDLEKIDTNEGNISSNLSEITQIKNSLYLKNIYNILIYESKTQIDFNGFYERIFDINANKNDFIEIFFKMELEYSDTYDRNYLKIVYELFDENNNSLYKKSVKLNNYIYISNMMTIDDNIFYNFMKSIKKLRLVINFKKISSDSRVITIWYIKNDNNRLILKHYGL